MTRPPRIGFLTHVVSAGDPKRTIDEHIRICVEAERMGYDSMWVAQHHFGAENGVVASPFVFLAALAARTERIRLGTAVVTLALEDPIRAAEDAALVDLISGGRLEVGLGSGAHPPSFTAMSRDFRHRSASGEVNAGALVSALCGDPMPGGSVLTPRSASLTQRIWRATSSRKGAVAAARAGHGVLLARSAPLDPRRVGEVQRPIAEKYLAATRSAGHVPRVGVTRTIVPATDAAVLAGLARDVREWSRDEQLPEPLARLDDAAVLNRHGVLTGELHRIAECLAADAAVRLATELIVQFQPGRPTYRDTLAALETLIDLRSCPLRSQPQ
ncbi:LLM class flavin-dependent oxidoreductase [Nocardia sp. NPDC057227]|uniref:LLM class flavin-dependent oxidoreductase n=1 Tax=Nocardia sp. NPDC057227 TaxID=3346056 RepID=UPI00362CEC29